MKLRRKVRGLVFFRNYVYLIRRPDGLDGFGGDLNEGANPTEKMCKEFEEDAAVYVAPDDWRMFCSHADIRVVNEAEWRQETLWFCTELPTEHPLPQTMSDLPVVKRRAFSREERILVIRNEKIHTELEWLIPMAHAGRTHATVNRFID